jgi:hypothetical protein
MVPPLAARHAPLTPQDATACRRAGEGLAASCFDFPWRLSLICISACTGRGQAGWPARARAAQGWGAVGLAPILGRRRCAAAGCHVPPLRNLEPFNPRGAPQRVRRTSTTGNRTSETWMICGVAPSAPASACTHTRRTRVTHPPLLCSIEGRAPLYSHLQLGPYKATAPVADQSSPIWPACARHLWLRVSVQILGFRSCDDLTGFKEPPAACPWC